MMPVPITVLDVDGRTQVELLQANSESRNKKFYFMSENNLTLLYMIDCVTKQRVKVDLRSLVRKKLKEVGYICGYTVVVLVVCCSTAPL